MTVAIAERELLGLRADRQRSSVDGYATREGIGAGQIPDGETRLCDTLHGEPASN